MKLKTKLITALASSVLLVSAANASVHCDEPNISQWGMGDGIYYPMLFSVHCTIVNNTTETKTYRLQYQGWIDYPAFNGGGSSILQQETLVFSPGQSVTADYQVKFTVKFDTLGYHNSHYNFIVSGAESFDKTFGGIMSVTH